MRMRQLEQAYNAKKNIYLFRDGTWAAILLRWEPELNNLTENMKIVMLE